MLFNAIVINYDKYELDIFTVGLLLFNKYNENRIHEIVLQCSQPNGLSLSITWSVLNIFGRNALNWAIIIPIARPRYQSHHIRQLDNQNELLVIKLSFSDEKIYGGNWFIIFRRSLK